MDEHLVAYFDFLGFSNLMQRHDSEAEEKILALLTSLASLRGDFRRDQSTVGIATRTTLYPAISAFSDHIVFSLPWSEVTKSIPFFTLQSVAVFAAAMARDGMELGCLLRGAVTCGPLHHAKGVVFGPALIEAHLIESRVAGHPRIVVVDKVAEAIGASSDKPWPLLYRDDDGLLCLDYMREAFEQFQRGSSIHEEGYVARNRGWIKAVRERCDTEIENLSRDGNLGGRRHWAWFRTRFDQMIASLHPDRTGERALLS